MKVTSGLHPLGPLPVSLRWCGGRGGQWKQLRPAETQPVGLAPRCLDVGDDLDLYTSTGWWFGTWLDYDFP